MSLTLPLDQSSKNTLTLITGTFNSRTSFRIIHILITETSFYIN
jgi:hypothetical protein